MIPHPALLILAAVLFALTGCQSPGEAAACTTEPQAAVEEAKWEQATADALTLEALHPRPIPQRDRPELLRGVDDPAQRLAIYREAIAWFGPQPPAGFDEWPRDYGERQSAAKAALIYGGAEAMPDLLEAWQRPELHPRSSLWMDMLKNRGRAALDLLHDAALNSPDSSVRTDAVTVIRDIQAPESVPVLIEALNDPHRGAVIRTAMALSDFRDPAALEPLAAELPRQDLREHGWYWVCDAMMEIDADFARPIVVPYAQAVQPRNQNQEDNRQSLLRGAARERSPKGHPIGIPAELEAIRMLAADAFTLAGESYGEDEIDQLIAHLNDEEWKIAGACIAALVHLDARQAVPHLIRAARQEPVNPYNTRNQISALTAFGGEEAIRGLVAIYRDSRQPGAANRHADHTVCYALKGLGPASIPILMAMLDDPFFYQRTIQTRSGEVVTHSHAALAQLGEIMQCQETIHLWRAENPALVDPATEAVSMQAWWACSRDAYLAGEPTAPPPKVTSYDYQNPLHLRAPR